MVAKESANGTIKDSGKERCPVCVLQHAIPIGNTSFLRRVKFHHYSTEPFKCLTNSFNYVQEFVQSWGSNAALQNALQRSTQGTWHKSTYTEDRDVDAA